MSNHNETAERLHPLETAALMSFKQKSTFFHEELGESSKIPLTQLRTAVEWLLLKNLITSKEIGREETVSLTALGEAIAAGGFPEVKIIEAASLAGDDGIHMNELPGKTAIEQQDINPLIGSLKKIAAIDLIQGRVVCKNAAAAEDFKKRSAVFQKIKNLGKTDLNALSGAEQEEVKQGFKKRSPEKGYFRIDEKTLLEYTITAEGELLLPFLKIKQAINQITPQLLASGKWKDGDIRKYDIHLNPPKLAIGKKHPYRTFLENVRGKLTSLGFEEMSGPVVETEFWDMDALFMPQFHAARNIHDVYFVKNPSHAKSIEEPFLSKVTNVHENGGDTGSKGWGYQFDALRTKRLVMRSQGTALSARTLASGPKNPGKYFAVARCFRYDQIDATHGTDFFQVEGIVVDENINFKKLLGLLKLFALEIAQANEIKFTPAYFPFTEPSVEMHARHPKLGWIELGGAGIFRPEVTNPLGIDIPVIAWGLGVDRMAMVALGINDIRQLFGHDLEFIRQSKVV